MNSSTGIVLSISWGGNASDIPIPGDYDGDGKTDYGVYRSSTRQWYIINSSTGAVSSISWGGDPSDVPLTTNPASYMY